MKKELTKLVRREVRRALTPTGLIGKRGPAKNVGAMVSKSMKTEMRKVSKIAFSKGREISEELGMTR